MVEKSGRHHLSWVINANITSYRTDECHMPSDKMHTEDNIISNGVLAPSTEPESTILRRQLSPNESPLK